MVEGHGFRHRPTSHPGAGSGGPVAGVASAKPAPLRSSGGVRTRMRGVRSLFATYVVVVVLAGLAGFVATMAGTDWVGVSGQVARWSVAFLALAALVGELKPLYLPATDEPPETISASTPFILALVSVGGVGIAVLIQAIVSLAEDLLRRRGLKKSAFNTAQYTLSVLAARFVFAKLAHLPFFGGPVEVDLHRLGPLLAGGLAMIIVNRVLVAVVVSMSSAQPLRRVFREDGFSFNAAQFMLLCIGAVAANVAQSGVAFLVLLCAPAIAVYLTTAASIRHAYQASHDSLTGAGNRDLLQSELNSALAAAQDELVLGPGLVLLDLDHFKDINDTLGHPVGDELLRQVAGRLVTALGEKGVVNRVGGDEFAVVVHGGLADAQALSRVLLDALKTPMRVGAVELLVRASAGVAVAPDHGSDATVLMKNADIALYQAKLERDRTSTYSPEFDVNTLERLQLLGDLRSAIGSAQLAVAYQPQLDLRTMRMVGVEALIRWNHPTRGPVPPDAFIPLAENSGLIAELTSYVLDTALGSLAQWRQAGYVLRMAVNLSARHLSDLALPRQVAEALARHGIPASALVLEVTETGIMSDPARADVVIGALRELGVEIAVDDYGTGHASLSYLKRLQVDELKIDRSFVSDMGLDRHDFIIVRSTITLAQDLGLRVIAEGIEDEETTVALRGLGCAIGQGFHLGRPTTAEAIRLRLNEQQPFMLPSQAARL
jgi:diguanylate cyclase (GGDEF)-like protein